MSERKSYKRNWADYNYPPDFEYCPLSEERVVRLLIIGRSKLDKNYDMLSYVKENGIPQLTGEASVVNEDVLCTYVDLDALISTCGLSDLEYYVVIESMKGYMLSDIAEDTGKYPAAIKGAFSSAVEKIVVENNRRWKKAMVAKSQ